MAASRLIEDVCVRTLCQFHSFACFERHFFASSISNNAAGVAPPVGPIAPNTPNCTGIWTMHSPTEHRLIRHTVFYILPMWTNMPVCRPSELRSEPNLPPIQTIVSAKNPDNEYTYTAKHVCIRKTGFSGAILNVLKRNTSSFRLTPKRATQTKAALFQFKIVT